MNIEAIYKNKLKPLFPDEKIREKAEDLLKTYGIESNEQGIIRVRLAILKLTEHKPTLEELSSLTATAKQDFRDILAWAEYPRQFKHFELNDDEKKQNLIKADLEEYQAWLNS